MDHIKYCLYIGRWQPLHNGHLWLINRQLETGNHILIYVRDIPPDKNNPYTTEQTVELINAEFADNNKVKVMVGPDIASVNFGRGVGYEILDHGECPIKGISATAIRDSIKNGTDEWKKYISPRVEARLREFHNL